MVESRAKTLAQSWQHHLLRFSDGSTREPTTLDNPPDESLMTGDAGVWAKWEDTFSDERSRGIEFFGSLALGGDDDGVELRRSREIEEGMPIPKEKAVLDERENDGTDGAVC